jgi:hypothetical protein
MTTPLYPLPAAVTIGTISTSCGSASGTCAREGEGNVYVSVRGPKIHGIERGEKRRKKEVGTWDWEPEWEQVEVAARERKRSSRRSRLGMEAGILARRWSEDLDGLGLGSGWRGLREVEQGSERKARLCLGDDLAWLARSRRKRLAACRHVRRHRRGWVHRVGLAAWGWKKKM